MTPFAAAGLSNEGKPLPRAAMGRSLNELEEMYDNSSIEEKRLLFRKFWETELKMVHARLQRHSGRQPSEKGLGKFRRLKESEKLLLEALGKFPKKPMEVAGRASVNAYVLISCAYWRVFKVSSPSSPPPPLAKTNPRAHTGDRWAKTAPTSIPVPPLLRSPPVAVPGEVDPCWKTPVYDS